MGEITEVNNRIIDNLMKEKIVPVLTPIAVHASGQKLNVNADYAAAAVAQSVGAEQCIFVTDVEGLSLTE